MQTIEKAASLCFQILTLAVVHLASGHVSSRSRLGCVKPTDEQLLEQLINATANYRGHDTAQHHWNTRHTDSPAHNLCAYIAHVDWTDGRSRPLSLRSLCPWIVENVTWHDRFPGTIAEARCICRRCQLEGSTNQCRPIHHPMIVLQKTRMCDERKLFIYRPVRYLVTVGCTCTSHM